MKLDGERFLKRLMAVLLTLRADCSLVTLKPAHLPRLLPLSYGEVSDGVGCRNRASLMGAPSLSGPSYSVLCTTWLTPALDRPHRPTEPQRSESGWAPCVSKGVTSIASKMLVMLFATFPNRL